MSKIGIFYGSTMGDTEEIAEMIAETIGKEKVDLHNVASVSEKELANYDKLLLGSSTWGLGDLQDDWDLFIEKVKETDFDNKKVAIFGTGDQEMYPDTFVDAIGKIYKEVEANGAEVIGKVFVDTYDFTDSEAVVEGQFVGLPIDKNNQDELTEDRVKNWVAEIIQDILG
ncbi:MAG: flavodoxin [Halothermotrichaceae bacterium]